MKEKVYAFESPAFLLFGVFMVHRVWAIVNPPSFSNFWINAYFAKHPLILLVYALLAGLGLAGTWILIRTYRTYYWWRLFFPIIAAYGIQNVYKIWTQGEAWRDRILIYYHTGLRIWDLMWGLAVIAGFISIIFSQRVLKQRLEYRIRKGEITAKS